MCIAQPQLRGAHALQFLDVLRPLLARNEAEERALTGTIGPFWDGNEVWVIAAAGVMFSTFPIWYGALFSGMYPAFVVILLALLLRGVSFEFRNQVDQQRWRNFWDWMSFGGSVVPSFLWGVVMAKIIEGLPLDAEARAVAPSAHGAGSTLPLGFYLRPSATAAIFAGCLSRLPQIG